MCGNRLALLKLVDLHQDGWVRLPEKEHRGKELGLRHSLYAMPESF